MTASLISFSLLAFLLSSLYHHLHFLKNVQNQFISPEMSHFCEPDVDVNALASAGEAASAAVCQRWRVLALLAVWDRTASGSLTIKGSFTETAAPDSC